jgi:hypothetical protein
MNASKRKKERPQQHWAVGIASKWKMFDPQQD